MTELSEKIGRNEPEKPARKRRLFNSGRGGKRAGTGGSVKRKSEADLRQSFTVRLPQKIVLKLRSQKRGMAGKMIEKLLIGSGLLE